MVIPGNIFIDEITVLCVDVIWNWNVYGYLIRCQKLKVENLI